MANILVSGCLVGCTCRYDAALKTSEKVLALAKDNTLIPVCPEQLGGLPTPRHPSERVADKVLRDDGIDVTKEYTLGANTVVNLAKLCKVDYCIMKSGSPACGCGKIYDGTFTGNKIPGDGIASEYLKKAGFKVITEEDL